MFIFIYKKIKKSSVYSTSHAGNRHWKVKSFRLRLT